MNKIRKFLTLTIITICLSLTTLTYADEKETSEKSVYSVNLSEESKPFSLIVSYKEKNKNGKIDQYLDQIPLKEIFLETDSPYLAPAPHRGKRNESSYVALVAQKLATIYGVSAEEIAQQTTKNALNIFKL